MSLPIGMYLYGLDKDPYDGKYKYYMCSPKNEWKVGRMIFQYATEGDEPEIKLHKDTKIESFLNDVCQNILTENGIPNASEYRVHLSKS